MSYERNFDDDEQRDRDALERLLGQNAELNHAMDGPFTDDDGSGGGGLGDLGTPDPLAPVTPPVTPDPVNTTMPVDRPQPTITPTSPTGGFQGQGAGWRGLDLTPVTNRNTVNPLHGFNLDRAFAGSDTNSTKDAFARWAAGIQTPLAGLDHAGVGNVINQNLDRARQMGLNILEVDRDRILIDTYEHGPMWVDVVENAGGSGSQSPAWAWQLQGDPNANPRDESAGGGGGGRSPVSPVSPIAPPEMPLTGGANDGNRAMDDILAEIEALMSGRGSPMDARALQGMLS